MSHLSARDLTESDAPSELAGPLKEPWGVLAWCTGLAVGVRAPLVRRGGAAWNMEVTWCLGKESLGEVPRELGGSEPPCPLQPRLKHQRAPSSLLSLHSAAGKVPMWIHLSHTAVCMCITPSSAP